jgi:hypothetical protein
LTGLLTKALKILPALPEILIDLAAICKIKSQRPQDLLQRERREGFRNSGDSPRRNAYTTESRDTLVAAIR